MGCSQCGQRVPEDGSQGKFCSGYCRGKYERIGLGLGIVPERLKPGAVPDAKMKAAEARMMRRIAEAVDEPDEDAPSTWPPADAVRIIDWRRAVADMGRALMSSAD
jgi:hypothetical protein